MTLARRLKKKGKSPKKERNNFKKKKIRKGTDLEILTEFFQNYFIHINKTIYTQVLKELTSLLFFFAFILKTFQKLRKIILST